MPNQPVPEESVEAVITAELARTGEVLVGREVIERRRGEVRRDLEAAAPAIRKQEREQVGAESSRLRRVLEELRKGPDTLTPDGLRIVNAAVHPDQSKGERE
jgi:hypothetical protein